MAHREHGLLMGCETHPLRRASAAKGSYCLGPAGFQITLPCGAPSPTHIILYLQLLVQRECQILAGFFYLLSVATGPWRRKWQPIPVFLPGESHGQRSLVGYSPWGCTESDTTEAT